MPARKPAGKNPEPGARFAEYRSPLGRRPYDLRHAAVSLWLNSGVPATEIARRAGHGVAVLLKIYAHCIDGQANAANQLITDALSAPRQSAGAYRVMPFWLVKLASTEVVYGV
jgi:integrase